jgi:RNA polymerase sigma-70 factor (ECF subfamily)
MVGSDVAADATQDTLLRAWADLRSLRDPARFDSWIRRILVNRCRDLVRARQRVRVISLDADPAAADRSAVIDPAPAIGAWADLELALLKLTVDQRAILALRYVADMPIRTVAKDLGIAEGTAKSRLHTATLALRRALGEATP